MKFWLRILWPITGLTKYNVPIEHQYWISLLETEVGWMFGGEFLGGPLKTFLIGYSFENNFICIFWFFSFNWNQYFFKKIKM